MFLGPGALSLAACFLDHVPEHGQGPELPNMGMADAGAECDDEAQPASGELDLLLVMDDSGSMKEEQAKVLAQLPRLVAGLASGDTDGDGRRDFAAITSMHLGVVSTNLGSAGLLDDSVASCRGAGDDGLMIREARSRAGDPACAELAAEPYQTYEASQDRHAVQVAAELGCLAALGTDGCGMEQPLEAMWKALAPQSDADFLGGHGHGDEANAGFLRPGATLAVLVVTDEVDCSISEAGKPLFDPNDDSFLYEGPEPALHGQPMGINFRCAQPGVAHLLQPIARYVEGLRSLEAGPERVLVSVIAGIPARAEDLEVASGEQDYEAILALPEMQIAPGPDAAGVLSHDALPRPACTAENGVDGSASPARRFVQLAAGLGAGARVWSICAASYERAFDDLIAKVGAPRDVGCVAD
jgi:hypothetical protein